MFEDIIGEIEDSTTLIDVDIDIEAYTRRPACISCGNININDLGGFLSSSNTFTKIMKCGYCSTRWHVVIDRNLKPLEIKREA